jgi:hypothetical protein
MPAARDVRSHFEAGVALLYGEIGALLDRLEKLRAELPSVVDAGTQNLNTSIIAIVKATRGAQAVIAGYGDAQERRLKEAAEQEREGLHEEVRLTLEGVVRAAEKPKSLLEGRAKTRWLVALLIVAGLGLACAGGAYVGTSLAIERQRHGER